MTRILLTSLISLFLFTCLATANGAGYRYGVSDQAFYIPAVLHAHDSATFPKDGALIEAQARLMVLDEVLAGVMRATGVPLHVLFAAGYVGSLILIWAALTLIGASLYVHRWTTVALLAAYTLRHQITRTSANTLEPYFHPRMLAFGVCALAVAAVLRRRGWAAIALVALGGAIHPTTALWFAVLIGVALLVSDRALRPVLTAAALIAAALAVWAVAAGPLAGSFVVIDADWRQVLASKTSLLANEWPLAAWVANLGTAAVWAWAYADRRRRGHDTREDTGLAAGGAALVALFLLTLPFVAAGLSFFVQLQASRVFWLVDLMATIYVLGAIERLAPGASPERSRRERSRRERSRRERSGTAGTGQSRWIGVAAAVLIAFSCVRGVYALTVDHPERRLFSFTLADTPWHDAMRWIAAQPVGVHVLADPGHAWKYGSSVRVSAGRDVFQEDVKDSALAIYSRDVAMRVLERGRALGDFTALTPARALALAAQYNLDYLVTTEAMDLPVAYRNQQFAVYALSPATPGH